MRDLGMTLSFFVAVASIFVVVFLVILEEYGQWSDYKSGNCEGVCESSNQCDHEMEDRPTIQQPVNAWTNLAYILAGLWPIIHIRRDISTFVYLMASIYLGVGSFMFHASVTSFWQSLDVAATYGIIATVTFHGIYALTNISWRWLALPLLGLVVAFSIVKKDMDASGMGSKRMLPLMVSIIVSEHVLLVGAYVCKILTRRPRAMSSASVNDSVEWKFVVKLVLLASTPGFLFGLAVLLHQKDSTKEWCMPDSFWQGHGAWHILTAFANLLIWIFFDNHRMVNILAPPPASTASIDDDENLEKANPGEQIEEIKDMPTAPASDVQQ